MPGISHASAPSTAVNQWQTVIPLEPAVCESPKQRDLERHFAKAFKCAYNTTGLSQNFYRPEFDRAGSALKHAAPVDETAHQAKEIADPDMDAVFSNFDAFLDELKQTGNKGLKFRLWRDGISLATSIALLATMASALMSQEERSAGDFSAANNPVGSPAADWGLVLLEWSKALVTTSLSYPTLKRHHLVDEFIKRATASAALLAACLEDQAPTSPVKNASQWDAVKRSALQCTEKGRDVSTLFTLLNATLPVVRGLLWSTEMMGGGTTPASWRGLLRLVQNGSDSLRSVFSTIGTASRNKLFGIELDQLKTALPALREQLRNCNPEQVLPQLKKMELLFSVCSTPLLSRIAGAKELIADFKKTDISSPDALENFLKSRQIPVAGNGVFLCSEAPENHWGERLAEGTYKGTLSMAVRAPYRLTLETQHQMSRPSEGLHDRHTASC
jgi:hypothetical protein